MARKGSAEKPVPRHTRVDDESFIWQSYDPGIQIGEGTFGKVFKVQHKATGEYWAMKVVNREKAGHSAVTLLEREVNILKKVSHENIISLNEVFETGKKMYLVMELCEGGELADALKLKKSYDEADTKVIVKKLASAISYLHKIDIVHRDLKLENILLSQNPDDPHDHLHIKVTDFGLSVEKGGVGQDNMMQDFCGTPIYMSPEIIDNKTYSQQCDIWAMGVIVYILLCGSPPFRSKDEDTLYDMIKRGEIDFSGEVWKGISEEAQDCIRGMLKVDPAHRKTAREVLNHPWITGNVSEGNHHNVLEMMKMWKDELKVEEGQSAISNGEGNPDTTDETDGGTNSPVIQEQAPQSSSHKANGKTTQHEGTSRKGSGGTKKSGTASKLASNSSRPNSQALNPPKPGLTPGSRNSVGSGSKSPSQQKFSNTPTSKGVTSTSRVGVGQAAPRGRGTRK